MTETTGRVDGPQEMSEADNEDQMEPEEPREANPSADRTDRLADALERLAFKIHDLGNWLMGFLR